MSEEHEHQPIFNMLQAQYEALMEKCAMTPAFGPASATPEALKGAADELQAMMSAHASIREVLLYFDPESTPRVRGLMSLASAISAMEQRFGAVQDRLTASSTQEPQRQRTDVSARSAVFNSRDLLRRVLSYAAGSAEWLYLASVHKTITSAYMLLVVESQGLRGLCRTSVAAAVASAGRLDLAVLTPSFTGFITGLSRVKCHAVNREVGAAGSLETLRRLTGLGLRIKSGVLVGAARHACPGLLNTLYRGDLRNKVVRSEVWCRVGLELARQEDAVAALVWLSQQVLRPAKWPRTFTLVLCQQAASRGRLSTLQFLLDPKRGLALFGPLQDATAEDGADTPYPLNTWWNEITGEVKYLGVLEAALCAGDRAGPVAGWLVEEKGIRPTTVTMLVAASFGHFQLLKEWWEAGYTSASMDAICADAVLGAETVFDMCHTRAECASVQQMQWIRSCGGGDWTPQGLTAMLANAMSFPTHSFAQWLRSEGAAWPENLHEIAVGTEVSLDRVIWAVKRGCPWGAWTSETCEAIASRSVPAKQALHDLGCPCQCARLSLLATPALA